MLNFCKELKRAFEPSFHRVIYIFQGMNKQILLYTFLFLFLQWNLQAQEISISFPQEPRWNEVEEGETLEFNLRASGGLSEGYRFDAIGDSTLGYSLSDEGVFRWTPDYSLVSAEEQQKTFPVIFEATNQGGQSTRRQVEFILAHRYRLDDQATMNPFLVRPGQENIYQLDIDSGEFSVEAVGLPQGLQLLGTTGFSWTPTETQWLKLENNPLNIDFFVIDQRYGDRIPMSLPVRQSKEVNLARQDKNSQTSTVKIQLPEKKGWNIVREGEVMTFRLGARGGKDQRYSFNMIQGREEDLGISFDTLGNFYWKPSYDLVERLEEEQLVQLIFEVSNASGESDRQQVELLLYHTNRDPQVGDLKTFYVQYNSENIYQLGSSESISDPDEDPLVFKPILAQMPQGMMLSGNGELTWKPSYGQYTRLQKEPLLLEFIVEDQPYKAQTKGRLRISVTQQDHPPQISMVPANEKNFEIREDEALNLKFYLSDPNGDQDIMAFDFVSDNSRIPRSALRKNADTQWEFVWTPGYDFFVEPGTQESYDITFFVIDRTNQRSERTISVSVTDAENLVEKDRLLYSQYREGLVRVMNLMDQLKSRQSELQKDYKKAKKGKKQRAITTASLGAITGLSPVVLTDNQQTQRYVSGIGGTTSMTIGSLEASNVIGKDPSDIFEKLSYINQKLNDLETQGEVFAGKYALPNNRRDNAFNEDLKKLIVLLSLKDVTTLELDASWRNPRKSNDKNIQETFKSFNPDPEKSSVINE
jgi:hypothetical protein